MAQVVRTLLQRQLLHLLSLGLQPPAATSTTAHRLCLRRNAHLRPPRALRPPRELDLSKDARTKNVRIKLDDRISDDDDDDDEKKKRKSRNEMKREARQSVRWAMDLASFSTPQIKRILKAASLEEDVFEAIMLVKRLGSDVREGKRRQYNYIGRLLRDADAQPDLLGALIQATKDGDHSRLQALAGSTASTDEGPEEEFHESESEPEEEHEDIGDHVLLASKWFDGLIIKDIQTSNEIYSLDSVDFDRQELRKLVRKVHTLQDRQNSTDETLEQSAELEAAKKKALLHADVILKAVNLVEVDDMLKIKCSLSETADWMVVRLREGSNCTLSLYCYVMPQRLLCNADAQPDLLGALIQATKDDQSSPEDESHNSEPKPEPEHEMQYVLPGVEELVQKVHTLQDWKNGTEETLE